MEDTLYAHTRMLTAMELKLAALEAQILEIKSRMSYLSTSSAQGFNLNTPTFIGTHHSDNTNHRTESQLRSTYMAKAYNAGRPITPQGAQEYVRTAKSHVPPVATSSRTDFINLGNTERELKTEARSFPRRSRSRSPHVEVHINERPRSRSAQRSMKPTSRIRPLVRIKNYISARRTRSNRPK